MPSMESRLLLLIMDSIDIVPLCGRRQREVVRLGGRLLSSLEHGACAVEVVVDVAVQERGVSVNSIVMADLLREFLGHDRFPLSTEFLDLLLVV